MRFNAEIVDRQPEKILRINKVDSAGRTREQREAMEKNELRPVKLRDADLEIAAVCADEHSEYPKVMYRLALRRGKPAGDEASPSYPMPFDLALQCGLTEMGFPVLNKTRDSPGNVVVKLPYITRSVGVIRDDLTIDIEAAKKEEAELRKQGWVDDPNKIRGLPAMIADSLEFDPLPTDEPEQPTSRNGKVRV